MHKGKAVVQVYSDRLEELADRKYNENQQGQMQILLSGKYSPFLQHRDRQGVDWSMSTSVEKALEVLAGSKLNVSQQCALAAKNAKCVLGYINRSTCHGPKKGIRMLDPV